MFYRTYQKITSAYLGIFEKKIFEIPRPQPILVPNAVHVLPSNGIFKPTANIANLDGFFGIFLESKSEQH